MTGAPGAILAPALARLGQRYPNVTVELVAEPRWIPSSGEERLEHRERGLRTPTSSGDTWQSRVGRHAASDHPKARGLLTSPPVTRGTPRRTYTEGATEETPRGSRRMLRQLRFRTGERTPDCRGSSLLGAPGCHSYRGSSADLAAVVPETASKEFGTMDGTFTGGAPPGKRRASTPEFAN